MSTCSCLSAGEPASTSRRLPDMPKWLIKVPTSALINRYLARRSTNTMRCPDRRTSRSSGIGQRNRRSRTITRLTRWPSRWGAIPRRVVSTSGNSGMKAPGQAIAGSTTALEGLVSTEFADVLSEVFEVIVGQADIIEHQMADGVPFVVFVLITQDPMGRTDMLGHFQDRQQVLQLAVAGRLVAEDR